MALWLLPSTTTLRPKFSPPPLRPFFPPKFLPVCKPPTHNPASRPSMMFPRARALSLAELDGAGAALLDLVGAYPPTWKSAALSNLLIFLLGSPILISGLSASGIGVAFLLGVLTWRAFGPPGFLLVSTYFVVGTVATKLKIEQKEAQGVAEKRRGRRGPGSVVGSSAAGCVCALLSICGVGGDALEGLWQLGFVASFCTKLSDTVSSEIGKAYGKTTYLVTTFKVVPPGTEGAVSIEGTIAGLLASMLLASVGYFMGEVDLPQAAVCVLASQIANFGESLIGAALQDEEGYRWLNNDAVNVINISIGSILAVLMQQLLLQLNNDAVNVIDISIGSILAVLMQQLLLKLYNDAVSVINISSGSILAVRVQQLLLKVSTSE